MGAVRSLGARTRTALRRFALELLLLVAGGAFLTGALLLFGSAFLSWGARRAHEADRQALERAVGAYRAVAPGLQPWPTISGRTGEPVEGVLEGYQCDGTDRAEVCSWIDIEALAAAGFLRGADAINSADSAWNITATNAPSGNYGWYVDAEGRARSQPPFSRRTGYP